MYDIIFENGLEILHRGDKFVDLIWRKSTFLLVAKIIVERVDLIITIIDVMDEKNRHIWSNSDK